MPYAVYVVTPDGGDLCVFTAEVASADSEELYRGFRDECGPDWDVRDVYELFYSDGPVNFMNPGNLVEHQKVDPNVEAFSK